MIVQIRSLPGQGKARLIEHVRSAVFSTVGHEYSVIYWPHKPSNAIAVLEKKGNIDGDRNLYRVESDLRRFCAEGYNVIYTTEKYSDDVNHTTQLQLEGLPIRVIVLSSTDVHSCRHELMFRNEWNETRVTVPTADTLSKRRKAMNTAVRKLRRNGVQVDQCDLLGASQIIQKEFDL